MSDAPVPAEDMDFETGDQNSVSTKVGTVGWPEGAENAEGVGPGSDEPEPEPEPEPPAEQPPTEPAPTEGEPTT